MRKVLLRETRAILETHHVSLVTKSIVSVTSLKKTRKISCGHKNQASSTRKLRHRKKSKLSGLSFCTTEQSDETAFRKLHFYLLTNAEGRHKVFEFFAFHLNKHGHIGGYKSRLYMCTQLQLLLDVIGFNFPAQTEEGIHEEQALTVRQENEAADCFAKTWEELTESQQKQVTEKLNSRRLSRRNK